jgi:ssDNA-binding Zn-finger/Zn-ribbon topoisomerase 1
MDALVEVRISPCPECGQNRWLMEVPEEVAREKHAKRAEDTPHKAYRRGLAIGAILSMGGVLGRIAFWRTLTQPEGPGDQGSPAEGDVLCANCGHQMSMTQGESRHRDWPIA